MRKIFLASFALVLFLQAFNANGQDVTVNSKKLDGIYIRETIPQRVPIPYPHLREADMLWTKRVWRIIDLKQKINHPLYYPTNRMQDRISLVQRLVDAIKYNEITAYDPVDDEFTTLLSYDQVVNNFGAVDKEVVQQSLTTGRDTTIVIPGEFRWQEVTQLLIKEEWFFDKQHSTMQSRIIGICPIRVYFDVLSTGDEDTDIGGKINRTQLFWVNFDEARTVLANTAVFNEYNDAQRVSFDDLFFKRRFSSYIIRESNVHNNRLISDYTIGGIPNMQESERIKTEIFNFEHDLWEY